MIDSRRATSDTTNESPFIFSPPRRLAVQLINWFGRLMERWGITLVDLTETALLDAPSRQSKLPHRGDDELRYPLKLLLNSLEEEITLNLTGRIILRRFFTELLVNRLRIQKDLQRYPEILHEKIQRPLFITGLPRTGTTLLHNLLIQDSSARYLRTWAAFRPSPPPGMVNKKRDSRINLAKRRIKIIKYLAPDFFVAHPFSATGPEECMLLLRHNLRCRGIFELIAPMRKYMAWLDQQDMVPTYRYYKTILQLLQWRTDGNHWVLKAPVHLFHLEALLTVFPDARVIITHRNPLQVVPSCCSLFAASGLMYRDTINLETIGKECIERLASMVQRGLNARTSADPSRFFDVHYEDLLKSPIDVVKRIYAYFGYSYDQTMEEKMHDWLVKNPQYKHGVHRYSLEQFGLTREAVSTRFAHYCQYFNIPQEPY